MTFLPAGGRNNGAVANRPMKRCGHRFIAPKHKVLCFVGAVAATKKKQLMPPQGQGRVFFPPKKWLPKSKTPKAEPKRTGCRCRFWVALTKPVKRRGGPYVAGGNALKDETNLNNSRPSLGSRTRCWGGGVKGERIIAPRCAYAAKLAFRPRRVWARGSLFRANENTIAVPCWPSSDKQDATTSRWLVDLAQDVDQDIFEGRSRARREPCKERLIRPSPASHATLVIYLVTAKINKRTPRCWFKLKKREKRRPLMRPRCRRRPAHIHRVHVRPTGNSAS